MKKKTAVLLTTYVLAALGALGAYDWARSADLDDAGRAACSLEDVRTARVEGVTTEEYGASKASRPFNSRLDKSKLTARGFTPLPPWQDALARYLKEIGE